MPPGSYVAMVRTLLAGGGLAALAVAPERLLLAAVVVGAPELMQALLELGALSAPWIEDADQGDAEALPPDVALVVAPPECTDVWQQPLWATCLGAPGHEHPRQRARAAEVFFVIFCFC